MQSLPTDRLAAAFLLAAIAGCVDAVGFTELGGYFVSFMSGNSTRLGLHLAYHEWPFALFAFGLVALFVGGAAAGALIVGRAGRAAPGLILLVEATMLALAAWLLDGGRPMVGAVLLPAAMGLANVFLLDDRANRAGFTTVTGTLVRIGVGLGRGGDARAVLRDMLLWLALVAGAMLGGAGRLRFGGDVLLAPAAALVAMGIAELLFVRRRLVA